MTTSQNNAPRAGLPEDLNDWPQKLLVKKARAMADAAQSAVVDEICESEYGGRKPEELSRTELVAFIRTLIDDYCFDDIAIPAEPFPAPVQESVQESVQEPVQVPAPKPVQEARPPRKRRRVWLWCVLLLVILGGALAAWPHKARSTVVSDGEPVSTGEEEYRQGLEFLGENNPQQKRSGTAEPDAKWNGEEEADYRRGMEFLGENNPQQKRSGTAEPDAKWNGEKEADYRRGMMLIESAGGDAE